VWVLEKFIASLALSRPLALVSYSYVRSLTNHHSCRVLPPVVSVAGSLFEILDGKAADSVLGPSGTLGLAIVGIPVTLFLFYAAVRKAQAETAQDDERFLKGGRR
jgi:hypothetical protein